VLRERESRGEAADAAADDDRVGQGDTSMPTVGRVQVIGLSDEVTVLTPRSVSRTAVLVAWAFLSACDPSRDVTLVNATGESIDVYQPAKEARYRLHMEVGQSITQGWAYGWGPPKRVIVADNASGAQLFCIVVTQADLDRLNQRVEIRPGVDQCPKP
jgi:hypothetical protein